MEDTDLYPRILGLSELWFVANVELDTAGGRVDVYYRIRWRCPTCGRERVCRGMPSPECGVTSTSVSSRPSSMPGFRAVACPQHGVLQVKVPWAEANERFILLILSG